MEGGTWKYFRKRISTSVWKDGKRFNKEITRLINLWTDNSPLENIALKAIHVMQAVLLQKPNKFSKGKKHIAVLERRLELWKKGNIIELLNEGESIQEGSARQRKWSFKAFNWRESNGILPLSEETLSQLEIKHPDNRDTSTDILLNGPIKEIHSIVFDAIARREKCPESVQCYFWSMFSCIRTECRKIRNRNNSIFGRFSRSVDEPMVLGEASITKGGSGPPGLDIDSE